MYKLGLALKVGNRNFEFVDIKGQDGFGYLMYKLALKVGNRNFEFVDIKGQDGFGYFTFKNEVTHQVFKYLDTTRMDVKTTQREALKLRYEEPEKNCG